jgi:flagellar biosynthetic protein FliR
LQQLFENPELQKFFLVFVRLSGLVVFAPPFMNQRLSVQLKGGLVFFLAIAVMPVVPALPNLVPYNTIDLAFAMLNEVLIGFIIGFSVRLLFTIFELAGEFVDKQVGFAMASLVDPQTDVTVSILGSMFMNLALFIFIKVGGHHWVIEAFAGSFRTLPLLQGDFNIDGIHFHMGELFLKIFSSALGIVFPIIAVVTLVYVAQGFLVRTIPQLQIFVIGFIFTITIGLTSIQIMLQNFYPVTIDLFNFFRDRVFFMVTHLDHG